jgi:acyl-CoA synthetase (AMP-forming)/AMP-acid ligase II
VYRVEYSDHKERISAEVVPREGSTIDPKALQHYCLERLSQYKVPDEIKVVSSIALTGSGKILRH